ncbi:MAG: cytochrome c biogenesis protein CcdA [Propionibacteriaceae bacterium]|jgi:cytochrome c-type biogenesis protein|nr:cytochrome c biogenesis protein CcdA [Propionibacteriaceae bacterium]
MELTIPLVLLAGVASFASPCFLPVVPVFAGYMTGQGAANPDRGRLGGVGQALVFMAAFSAVFIAGWAVIGLIGWVAGDYRAWLRIGGGIVLVVLGLHVSGLLRIGLLDRVLRASYNPDMAEPPNWRRSALLGLAFAAGWTPCIGPVLGGVLGLATTADSLGSGLGLLVVYCLGLGVPFVLVSAGITSLASRLKWFVRHQRGVNAVAGMLLIAVGFLMIADLFSRLSALIPEVV